VVENGIKCTVVPFHSLKYIFSSAIMKQNFSFYLGFVLTFIVGVVLTPLYFIGITVIRIGIAIIEIFWDSLTLVPRALYEYEKAYDKRIRNIKQD